MTTYATPPIIEALIDFQLADVDPSTFPSLEQFVDEERQANYPTTKNLEVGRAKIELGRDSVATSAARKHIGYVLFSEDGKRLWQIHPAGVTFSRLAPYLGWEALRDEARRLWQRFRSAAPNAKVTRVAVRYINRLDLPLPLTRLRDYLTTVPEVPVALPGLLDGFFSQLRIPWEDISSNLVITATAVPPPKPDLCSVVLDIDLFRTADVPGDDYLLWDFVEIMHNRKNVAFEASITSKARELFR